MQFEVKAAKVERIDAALERWHRRLTRAIREVDKLRAQRKRLTAPRKLAEHERNPEPVPFDDDLRLVAPGAAGPC